MLPKNIRLYGDREWVSGDPDVFDVDYMVVVGHRELIGLSGEPVTVVVKTYREVMGFDSDISISFSHDGFHNSFSLFYQQSVEDRIIDIPYKMVFGRDKPSTMEVMRCVVSG